MATLTVSSPGKVLLAGGYLVLDPAYSGAVVSTSSRFYTVVTDDKALHVNRPIQIRVRSPQFLDGSWSYSAVFLDDNSVVLSSEDSEHRNRFVHLALQKTLAFAAEIKGAALRDILSNDLNITIAGDNDFYSQRAQLLAQNLPPTLASLALLPPFSHAGVPLKEVHKTGLGSSAALITSLVSALLLRLQLIPADSFASGGDSDIAGEGRRLAHNLAQYVHCLAQGKVGSGFDVSAAVFGSQLYTRFDPAVLQPLMDDNQVAGYPLYPQLSVFNQGWNYRVVPFKLPPLTRLMLADVDAGSDTPSLVGKVLKWRQDNSETAYALWNALDKVNQALANTLMHLSELHAQDPAAYSKDVKYLSTLQSVQWLANPNLSERDQLIIEMFSQARDLTQDVRAKMRTMGELAGVPIEPPEQTALLDACVAIAGVIGGGVPGAGGYDAIWLLVFDPTDCPPTELPSSRAERLWASWKGLDVSPLSATESVAQGVRVEQIEDVPGLAAIVPT